MTVTVTATNGTQNGKGTTIVSVSVAPPPVITVTCGTVTAGTQTQCIASAKIGGVAVNSARITHVDWDWGNNTTTSTNSNIGVKTLLAGTYQVNADVTITGVTGTTAGSGTALVQ
jgi:hypothetical protein